MHVWLWGIGSEARKHVKLGNDVTQQTQRLDIAACDVDDLSRNAPLLFCILRLHLQMHKNIGWCYTQDHSADNNFGYTQHSNLTNPKPNPIPNHNSRM